MADEDQLTLAELISEQSAAQVLQVLLDLADANGLSTSTWKSGDPMRTLLTIDAQKTADLTSLFVLAIRGGLLDYAEEGWLRLLAKQVYDVTFIPKTAASGEVTLTLTGAASYTFAAGDLQFQASSTGKTYRNVDAGTLDTTTTPLTIAVLAEEGGSDSSAAPTEIDTLVTTLLGVTVSNANALVGTDVESDESLRERCRSKLGALSPNGPKAAYEYFARSALREDGSFVDINRVRVSDDSATGEVVVVVASSSGAPIGDDLTIVDEAIQENCVPLTVTCTVEAAEAVSVAITYTAYVPDDAAETDAELEEAIENALIAYFTTLPIGGFQKIPGSGKVWRDLLSAVIASAEVVSGVSSPVFSVTLTAPGVDVDLADNEVAILGAITPTITRVAQ